MIDLFGPVPVLANLSARQAKDLDLLTSGTSGQPGYTSSKSAALESLLVSKLQIATRSLGSTLYKMTWKPWVMPSGRSRFLLRASVLRTSGTEPTGWPTPTARDWKDGGGNSLQCSAERLTGPGGLVGSLADAHGIPGGQGSTQHGRRDQGGHAQPWAGPGSGELSDFGRGPVNGFWADADWLSCRDGKWRPVEPGTFPLAHGAASRVGRLRAYGNAINAEAAKTFIAAYMQI